MSDSSYFPIFVDLKNRAVLVVGYGNVGRRKATKLIAAGALVTIVDPNVSDPSIRVNCLKEEFRESHLDGIELAFACALPGVNREVVAAGKLRGIWVNAASEPGDGDFILPAILRRGNLQIAVGTGGASPSLAKRIREKLERLIETELAEELRELESLSHQVEVE